IDILPPGRQLADLLEQITDRSALADGELVAVLAARARQIAHLQAELLADMVAVAGRCHPRISEPPPGAGRWAEPVDHGADEIAAALSWTSLAAGCQLEFAERLIRRLPAVYQAMLAGQIDYPKAKVFVDLLGTDDDIDPKVVAVVVDRVLPDAPGRTTAQLRRRIRRLVMAADPDAAARRSQEAATARCFVGPLGTNADIAPRVVAGGVHRVLPDAPDGTPAQLRRRIRRLVMAAGPDAAARRYQEAVTRRRFEHGAEPDGTALLAG